MRPDVEAAPWPAGIDFPERANVYDLVYNPMEIRFLRETKFRGA
jgi:shikimate 5-dehydrogenase